MAAREYVPGENECIHLIFPNPNGKIEIGVSPQFANTGGMHTIACAPNDASRPKCFSQEVLSVNCPVCKTTGDFKRIELEQLGGMNEADKKAHFYALKVKLAKADAKAKAEDASRLPQLKEELQAEANEIAAAHS